jgi:HPt (histidine-containing phosphotransfer) domain-containing protein
VNRLKESSDNDVAILEELYKAFQQNIKERVPLLELALKNEDQKNAVLYSHDFKGSHQLFVPQTKCSCFNPMSHMKV